MAYGLNFGLPLHVVCLSVVAGFDGVSHKELEAINLDMVFTSLGVIRSMKQYLFGIVFALLDVFHYVLMLLLYGKLGQIFYSNCFFL